MRIDAKKEMLELLRNAEGYSLARYTARIREILETHTLEPIDDRPFDPTLCGFREENGQLVKGDGEFFIENNMGCLELWALGEDEPLIRIAKWPVAHSLMERLLKLLGVLWG